MCQLKHLSRPDVTKSAIWSKFYVKAQNKRNSSSVVVSFLRLKMANLSDLMGFALTAAARYEETRVESSFSTAPAPSRFLTRNSNHLASKSNTRLTERLFLLLAFNRRSIQNPGANRQIIFQKCSFRSNKQPPPGFRVPRSNSHTVCTTLIG